MKNKSAKKVKVVHSVIVDPIVAENIFNSIVTCVKTVYTTVEEEAAAIAVVRAAYDAELACIAKDAFKAGKRICSSKADVKDTGMYVDPIVHPVV